MVSRIMTMTTIDTHKIALRSFGRRTKYSPPVGWLVFIAVLSANTMPHANAQAINSGQVYYIHPSAASGESLDANAYGITLPTPVQVYGTKTANTLNQNWRFVATGDQDPDGAYYFVYTGYNNGYVLDVANGGNTDGTSVRVWSYNGSDAQKWKAVDQGNGFFRLTPRCAPAESLDLPYNDPTAGKYQMQLYHTIAGDAAQNWRVLPTQGPIDIVVAPNGSDGGQGTLDQPFQTIERARQFIRTTGRNQNMTQSFSVLLRGGIYPLPSTQNFDVGDSGSNGHSVYYQSYPYEMATLSGGKQITGWTQRDAGRNIWGAPAQGLNFRQLYVADRRATRARTPNKTSESDLGPYLNLVNWDNQAHTLSINSGDINTNWSGLTSSVEMVVKNQFDVARLPIANVSIVGGTAIVTPQDPERTIDFGSATSTYHAPGQSYYFENSYDFLDSPGEWFLDRTANTVYYIPRPGENMTSVNVVAPITEDMVDVHGGAHDITLQWLTIQHAGWIPPSNEMIGLQSGLVFNGTGGWNSTVVPGGVRVSGATNVTFAHCTINHMGGVGLEISDSTNHVTLDRCQVYDISSCGVWDDPGLIDNSPGSLSCCFNDVISNCSIHDVGRDYTGTAGIVAGFSNGLHILHNEVYNSPYVGISVGLGSTASPTSLGNNIISYNNVHDVMQLHDDNAGIYTQSLQPGTQITYNWVHDIKRSGWAEANQVADVYLDNNSSQITVANNALDGAVGDERIHTQVDAHDNTIFDNETLNASTIAQAGPPARLFPKAVIAPPSGGPHAGSPGSTLQSGCYLRVGQYLEGGGTDFCVMQGDGNLVIYKGSDPSNNQGYAWSTGTGGRPLGAYFATVSYTGLLQVFAGTPEVPGALIWRATPYQTPPSASATYTLYMQGDGNLVLLGGYGYNDNQGNPSIGYWDRINAPPGVIVGASANTREQLRPVPRSRRLLAVKIPRSL